MDDVTIRASDADRERTVAVLGQHVGAGRLTLEEFHERAGAAYRARTLGDLGAVTLDLPAVAPEPADIPNERSLVPLLAVIALLLALAVLLTGALLAQGGPVAADPVNAMMPEMARMCG